MIAGHQPHPPRCSARLVLCGTQSLPLADVLIEVFSAIGTVGMSTGITRELSTLSALVVTLLCTSAGWGAYPSQWRCWSGAPTRP